VLFGSEQFGWFNSAGHASSTPSSRERVTSSKNEHEHEHDGRNGLLNLVLFAKFKNSRRDLRFILSVIPNRERSFRPIKNRLYCPSRSSFHLIGVVALIMTQGCGADITLIESSNCRPIAMKITAPYDGALSARRIPVR